MNKLLVAGIVVIAIGIAADTVLNKYIAQKIAIQELTEKVELYKTANEITKATMDEYLKKSEALEKELSERRSKVNEAIENNCEWSNTELPIDINSLFNANRKSCLPTCRVSSE